MLASDLSGDRLRSTAKHVQVDTFSKCSLCNETSLQSSKDINGQWSLPIDSVPDITMTGQLSNTEAWSLLACSAASLGVLSNTWSSDGAPVFASLALSGLAFSSSYAIIRWTGDAFIRVGRKGKDMSKKQPIELSVIFALQ